MIYSQPQSPGMTSLRKHIAAYPQSPLVVRFAAALVEAGEYESALKLCRAALETYHDYPTLHLLIAKAQIAIQQFVPARNRLAQLLIHHPACLAAQQLLERSERLERQSLLQGGMDNKGIPDVELSLPEQQERQKKSNWSWREHLIPGEEAILTKRARDFKLEPAFSNTTHDTDVAPTAPDRSETTSAGSVSDGPKDASDADRTDDDTDLERLAGRLDAASMPRITQSENADDPGPEFEPVNLESRPVTETLAEIYVKQGKLSEAIDAFRKLREVNRDKRYEYTVRISEIKRLIDERSEGER